MTYNLMNAQRQHEKHPDTFEVPSRAEILPLTQGDYVKLCFLPHTPTKDEPGGERMWVQVVHNGGDGLWEGRLDNEPVIVDSHRGAGVPFHWYDVLQIEVVVK